MANDGFLPSPRYVAERTICVKVKVEVASRDQADEAFRWLESKVETSLPGRFVPLLGRRRGRIIASELVRR